tara:strand:- start:2742 stop:2930 length:189 start_codon:yes stop_codon:yes gene_type:complete
MTILFSLSSGSQLSQKIVPSSIFSYKDIALMYRVFFLMPIKYTFSKAQEIVSIELEKATKNQ